MTNQGIKGSNRTQEGVAETDRKLGKQRSEEVKRAVPKGENQWSSYPQDKMQSPMDAQEE